MPRDTVRSWYEVVALTVTVGEDEGYPVHDDGMPLLVTLERSTAPTAG